MLDADGYPQNSNTIPASVPARTRTARQGRKRLLSSDMKIVDQERGAWTMLTLRADFFFDVRCDMGPYSLYLLIKLNDMERRLYSSLGRSYIESFAKDIRSSPPRYYDRNQPIEIQKMVGFAIGNS